MKMSDKTSDKQQKILNKWYTNEIVTSPTNQSYHSLKTLLPAKKERNETFFNDFNEPDFIYVDKFKILMNFIQIIPWNPCFNGLC